MKRAMQILKFAILIEMIVSSRKVAIAQQHSIPTDMEIRSFLIEGNEWASRSPELCDSYRVTFDDPYNDSSQGSYTSYFRKEEGEWRYRGSGSGASFTVEDSVLTITVGRPSRRERPITRHRITAASENQIDMVTEAGQPFSYFNCINDMGF